MKTTIKTLGVATVLLGFAQAYTLLDQSEITLGSAYTFDAANGITVTTSQTGTGYATNGTDSSSFTLSGAANTVTFTFNQLVDFRVGGSVAGAANVIFDDGGSTFTANTGTWTYTAGTIDLETHATGQNGGVTDFLFNGDSDPATITGSTLLINTSGQGLDDASSDWGYAEILGVNSVTFSVSGTAATEAFHFYATESTVPEPTSAALLGLGGLALLSRRKRN